MAKHHTFLLVILPIATFAVVMLTVTTVLECVIFFSLFVGIPAGFVTAAVVWLVLCCTIRSRDGRE